MNKQELVNNGWKPENCKIGTLFFKDGFFCRFRNNGNVFVFSANDDMNPLGEAETLDDIFELQKLSFKNDVTFYKNKYEAAKKYYEAMYNEKYEDTSDIEEHEDEKKSEGSNVPSTIDEAISQLDKELSNEDKEYLLKNGPLSVHDSLGRYIRNEWGLWGDNYKLKKELQDKGFEHPDDMSNHILEEFIKHLTSM